jgi:beta-lactamase regulating signal transducer with metallopeptidase domain
MVACGVTFFWELLPAGATSNSLLAKELVSKEAAPLTLFFQDFLHFYAAHTSWIIIGWSFIFCVKMVHLTGAMAYNYQVRKQRLPITDAQWKATFQQLAARLGIRQEVAFFESAVIHIPVVIGHLKPIIFLPVGMLTRLSPAEVEAVLLHELAHIKRKDYLVNLFQLAVESIFFFNPAFLWMSSLLRETREHCCDDLAIATTNNKKGFIQALVSFQEHVVVPTRYAVAFPAAKNQLLKRVTRIIYQRNTKLDTAGKSFIIMSLILSALLVKAATDKITVPVPDISTTAKAAPIVDGKPLTVDVDMSHNTQELVSDLKPSSKSIQTITKTSLPVTRNRSVEHNPTRLPLKVGVSVIHPRDEKEESILQDEEDRFGLLTEQDRQFVDRGRAQVMLDRLQADKDREQAILDREQAMKDREQAAKDRIQAEKDRKQAAEDRKRIQVERTHFLKDRTQPMSRTIIDI